jgi:hypothetical protein
MGWLLLGNPLWPEFHEASQPLWNAYLAVFLIALVVGAFFGVRYLQKNKVDVGEARSTTPESDR